MLTHKNLISERSRITAFPSSQTVTNGDIAIFQCNAKGSNISVRWNFNGSFCGLESCEQNGIYIDRTQDTNLMINSTLEIRTGELHSFIIEGKNYSIQCIVEQNLESSSPRNNITITLTVDPQQVTKSDGECMHIILCLHNIIYQVSLVLSKLIHPMTL